MRLPLILALAAIGLTLAPAGAFAGSTTDSLEADEGSLTPVAGKKGVYTLVLRDIEERPATVRGLLKELFDEDAPDPQAMVDADGEDPVRLRMTSAVYNAERDVLRIRVVATGTRLPRELDDVSLSVFGGGAGPPVAVFNTNLQQLSVTVNGGAAFSISGVVPPDYTPQRPRTGPEFGNRPGPNTLGYGQNNLTVAIFGEQRRFSVTVPSTAQVFSLQLYLFVDFDVVRWTLLNNGQPAASGSST